MTGTEYEYYLKVCWLKAHPRQAEHIRQSIEAKMVEQNCSQDLLCPVSLMPLMLNPFEIRLFEHTSQVLYRAIHKTIEASFASPQLRKYFHEDLPREWLEGNDNYHKYAVLTQLEAIFDGTTLKYIEFNTDNPTGHVHADIVQSVFPRHSFYQTLLVPPQTYAPISEKYLAAVKSIYQKSRHTGDNPAMAFIYSKNSAGEPEIKWELDYVHRRGIKVISAEPCELHIRQGCVYAQEQKIDVMRRCIKASSFMECAQKLESVMQAYRQGAFVMINPLRTVYGAEKSMLSLMSFSDFHHLYDPEEVQVIERHIPWTRQLSELETRSPDGQKITLAKFLKKSREQTVLKSSWNSDGNDVFLGKDLTEDDWSKVVDEHIGNKDWIAQEYVSIPQIPIPIVDGEKVTVQKRYFNCSIFLIQDKFAGLVGKYSTSPVINIHNSGGILPILQYYEPEI